MHRHALRSTFALASAAMLAAGCAPDRAITAPDAVAGAMHGVPAITPYTLDVESLTLGVDEARVVEARHRSTGEPVPAGSLQWASADASVATVSEAGEVRGVGVGTTVVSATRGAHRLDVAVTVTGCGVLPLPVGVTTGAIAAGDCLAPFPGRLSDYYSLTPARGEVVRIATSGIAGITGFKEAMGDPTQGFVFGTRAVGTPFRIIGNGDPMQLFLADGGTFGAYAIDRAVDTETHACSMLTFLQPGTRFDGSLRPDNSCVYTVAFTPVPEAMGKPLHAHRYWVRLAEVKPYTVTLEGVSPTFDPALTVFPNVAGGAPVAQATPGPEMPTSSTRAVTFTPPAPGYYLIEIASGRFVGSLDNWVVQAGGFSLEVSR